MRSVVLGGKEYDLVFLDFESHWDTGYSLSSLSTTDYVHDGRFKVHGVALKRGDGPAYWVSGEDVSGELRRIPWDKTFLVAHNTLFDGYILSQVYGHVPLRWGDTLSMARASLGHHHKPGGSLDAVGQALGVGQKIQGALVKTKGLRELSDAEDRALGSYAINDVELCARIFEKLYDHIPDDELALIHLTLQMFCEPKLRVNRARAQREQNRILGQRAWRVAKVNATETELRSRTKFAELLLAAGGTVPKKISKDTGEVTYAFAKSDEGFKALLRSNNEAIRELAEAKLAVSSSGMEKRAARFVKVAKDLKKLPVYLKYSGAHTHRWSGGDKMNMQNLERGSELRKAICAPPGYVVVVADSAQIEARTLAWLADEQDLLAAFARGHDLYSEFASFIFKRPIDRRRTVEREGKIVYPDFAEGFVGKTCILGLGYGMGPDRLHDTLLLGVNGPEVDLPRRECQKAINHYRQKYWRIPQFWEQMDFVIQCMDAGVAGSLKCLNYGKNHIRLPSGLFLQYPGLVANEVGQYSYQSRRGPTKLYGGLLTENITQALARQIIAEQMLKIAKRYRICLMTHDEIVFIAPRKEGKAAFQFALEVMSQEPDWCKGLPLKAEGGFAHNYSK